MSLDQGLRYESGFGFHNQLMASENYNRQFHGNYLENSLNKLYSQVEAHDNQSFPSSQNFGDALLGPSSAGTTLQSLLENFGHFDLGGGEVAGGQQQLPHVPQPLGGNAYPWPMPEPETKGSPMKFPSQVLTQNPRASPFSDTTESSLFSSCSNLSQPQFSAGFSSSSLLSSQSSASKVETNSLGLSDISTRLEELSQGSLMSTTRDSTPLSWNPIINYGAVSSKTSSLTSSPVMSHSTQPKIRGQGPLHFPAPGEDPTFFSDDDDENLVKILKKPQQQPLLRSNASLVSLAKPKLHKSMSSSCVPDSSSSGSGATSWSQIVRTSSTKLPSVSPVHVSSGPVTRGSLTPSPNLVKEAVDEPQLVVEEVPPTTNTVDFHRGPKVDPRWPVSQQVFLGPIPMSITWDEIRNVFYTKVQRRELLHFYVQSKPVNEVVYGQVVFDKSSLASKIVKDGPVKVRGHLINVTLMKEKVKLEKKK